MLDADRRVLKLQKCSSHRVARAARLVSLALETRTNSLLVSKSLLVRFSNSQFALRALPQSLKQRPHVFQLPLQACHRTLVWSAFVEAYVDTALELTGCHVSFSLSVKA